MTNSDFESMVEISDPCNPEEKRRIVTELTSEVEENLKEGNLYFVISNRWYRCWQRYVGLETSSGGPSEVPRPGSIANHDIIDSGSDASDSQIQKMLEEGIDYVLVPEQVWKKLVEWYKGGPPIPRKLLCQGFDCKSYSVEVYPLCLTLTDRKGKTSTITRLSRQASVSQLHDQVCAERRVSKEKTRIWQYFKTGKFILLDPSSDKSLGESCLQIDQDCTIIFSDSESLETLPDEMIFEIMARVPNSHEPFVSCVCKRFQKLIHSTEFTRIKSQIRKSSILIMFADKVHVKRHWFRVETNHHRLSSIEFSLPLRIPIRAVISSGRMVFFVCGSQSHLASLWSYSSVSKCLNCLISSPIQVTFKSAALVSKKIYIIGKRHSNLRDVDVFDRNGRELLAQCFDINTKLWELSPLDPPHEDWSSAIDISIERRIYAISLTCPKLTE